MEKRGSWIEVLILCLLITAILLKTSAIENTLGPIQQSPASTAQEIQAGIQQIQETPEQIRETYLTQEWSKIIANSSVIGPVHKYFLAHPLPFNIVFGDPYSFTPTFLLIVIFWILILWGIKDLLGISQALEGIYSWIGATALTIIIAQLAIISFFAQGVINLMLSKEAWWARTLIVIGIIIVIILLTLVNRLFAQYISQVKKERKAHELETKVKKSEAFIKGVKEGRELRKEIPESDEDITNRYNQSMSV